MKVDYKKDLRHNYMVLMETEDLIMEPYCIKMLEQQTLEGILPFEQRLMDNKILFYYEITGKQSMINLFDKLALPYERMKQLISNILNTIERSYEYLLPEDDFMLTPEFIYLDVATSIPSLCFLSGYKKSMKEQMNSLLEYLMNKVDYTDKDAVLLVYQLYAVSREEGFTFDHLYEVLNKKAQSENIVEDSYLKTKAEGDKIRDKDRQFQSINPQGQEIQLHSQTSVESKIPVMMERLEGEEEVLYYPVINYIYTGICSIAGILLIVLGITTRIIYNSYGDRVDYNKLFALLLIVFCVEGYLMKKVWDKKNKITRLVTTSEYIDPRQEVDNKRIKPSKKTGTNEEEKKNKLRQQEYYLGEKEKASSDFIRKVDCHDLSAEDKLVESMAEDTRKAQQDTSIDDDYNPTCLLNDKTQLPLSMPEVQLKSLEEEGYKSIHIKDFPFFIGKLKKNVDYFLEKDVVSRYHAKITKEEQKYFVTDLNSTNGTFVNQKALQTYEKQEIMHGDEITFANLRYEFIIKS